MTRVDTCSNPHSASNSGVDLPSILVLASNEWDTPWWMSRQHLFSRLSSRGWPVVYSTGAHNAWHHDKKKWRQSDWRQTFDRVQFGDGHVLIDRPGKLFTRLPSIKAWDRLALGRHASGLVKATRGTNPEYGVLILTHPKFWPYVELIPHRRLILYVHDAYDMAPGWDPAWEEDLKKLADRADLVIAVASNMIKGLPVESAKELRILPHGVDSEGIASGATSPCPSDLASIPSPRLGYIGRVNLKTDLNLVLELARRRPQWQWVFIGAINRAALNSHEKAENNIALLHKCPNVHFLGPKDRRELPAYLAHMDVNTLVYRFDGDGYWSATYPTKIFEYLAAGKPVVSSPLENIQSRSSVIDIAQTADEWIAAIERALKSGGVGTREQRQQLASENDWDHRTDILESWLLEIIRNRQ